MVVSRLDCALGVAVIALACLFGPGGHARAEPLAPAVVVVIDSQLLLKDSAAGKDIRDQVERIHARYQDEIDRREVTLRAEEEELRRQQTILSPEAFAEKGRDFQGKVLALQAYVQNTTRMLDESVRKATDKVKRAILVILDELSAEHGFNLVLDKSQVFIAFETLELSQQVLERLDQRLPTVVVELPAQE